MTTRAVRFGDLIEMIDKLPLEERVSLVDVVRQRIADDERSRIAASVRAARREHKRGRCKPVTPKALLQELLR